MAPPWEAPKPRRKWLGLTQNSLVTAVISVLLSGVVSYLVAHQQSEDSARQAVTGQQIQQIIQLESDAKSYFDAATNNYQTRAYCRTRPPVGTPPQECVPKGKLIDEPAVKALINSEDALSLDLANISDRTATNEMSHLEGYVQVATYNASTHTGDVAWTKAVGKYDSLITRCGQLIQGRN